jgi:hypothetical protein
LIEAAANHLLLIALGKPELENIICRLELSGQTTGKFAFFKNMNFLDTESLTFIQNLSEVRNNLVHDVSKVSITLEQYVSNLNDEKRKKINAAFKWKSKKTNEVQIKK